MNKSVLITGGAKRVGREISLYLAGRGFEIGLHYNSSRDEAMKIKSEIEKSGGHCNLFCHDLRDISGIPALMEEVRRVMPTCSVLVNNASIIERVPFMESSPDLLDDQFDVNFKAPVFLTQAFARIFKSGVVVNILDTNVIRSSSGYFMYLLSKKSLRDFTLMAAHALAPNIRVNAVCPGTVLPDSYLGIEKMQEFGKKLPSGKTATPEEVASAVYTLIESEYLNGQILFVDGGQQLI